MSQFQAVCLFCILGLLLGAAIVAVIAPESLVWVLAHIK